MCLIHNTGNVASVSDFEKSGYSGFDLSEAQTIRAKRVLARTVIENACATYIGQALSDYDCEQIITKLINDQGFTRTFVRVGHPDE